MTDFEDDVPDDGVMDAFMAANERVEAGLASDPSAENRRALILVEIWGDPRLEELFDLTAALDAAGREQREDLLAAANMPLSAEEEAAFLEGVMKIVAENPPGGSGGVKNPDGPVTPEA